MINRLPAHFCLAIAFCLSLACGCANVQMLSSRVMTLPKTLPGYYTAILYGGKPGEERDTALILAAEGTGYKFRVCDLNRHRNCTVMQHIRGDEVVALAQNVFNYFVKSTNIQFKKILDKKGQIIGYEITPFGFTLAPAAPPYVTYTLRKDGVVDVMIWPSPDVERRLQS